MNCVLSARLHDLTLRNLMTSVFCPKGASPVILQSWPGTLEAFAKMALPSKNLVPASVASRFPLKLGVHQAGPFGQLDADVVVDKCEPETVAVDVRDLVIVKDKRAVALPLALQRNRQPKSTARGEAGNPIKAERPLFIPAVSKSQMGSCFPVSSKGER